jgi:hypothetical protein
VVAIGGTEAAGEPPHDALMEPMTWIVFANARKLVLKAILNSFHLEI